MSVVWKVTSQLAEPIEVTGMVSSYSYLGVTLHFDMGGLNGSPRLAGWHHELEVPDDWRRPQVLASSESALRPVLDAISLSRGERLSVSTTGAVQIAPEMASLRFSGYATINVSAHLVSPAKMPDPVKLAAAVSDLSFRSSLDLANEARDAANDEHALQTYAKIWEDLHGDRPAGPATSPAHALTYTRDFVAHATIDNKNVLSFLHAQFNKPVNRYDRHSSEHREFVKRQRVAAQKLIDAELSPRIY